MAEVHDDQSGPLDLTVLLPCYNEAEAVGPVLEEIRVALSQWPGTYEIVCVDDASTDGTADLAEAAGARVIRRPENGGYGSSLQIGTAAARGRAVATMDADGSYVPAHLPELLAFYPKYLQVNGARASEQGTMKVVRFSAKLLIRKLAEYVSGKRIPDLNTGMKLYDRQVMLRYFWCLPKGFSCSTSMSLAFLCDGHPVKYLPVGYRKRIGTSKFHPIKDAARYGSTVLRIVMYFRPLRVFIPLSLFLILLAAVHAALRWAVNGRPNLADSDVILIVGAVLVLAIGLLADLIVAQRRGSGYATIGSSA